MKILFLEDDENRIKKARQGFVGHQLVVAQTAREAIELLKNNDFEAASLDHDLGGKQMAESDENSGLEVARFISEMWPRPDVVIHSFNPVGAKRMQDCFDTNKGKCCRVLFDLPEYWMLFGIHL